MPLGRKSYLNKHNVKVASCGLIVTKLLLNALEIIYVSSPLILFFCLILFCVFCFPNNIFGKSVLFNSNCSSIYSILRILRSEVNLLLNVVHNSLFSTVGLFWYTYFSMCFFQLI